MAAKYMVTGVAEVDRALREFAPKLANKMYRSAMRKVGKTVAESAKRNLALNKSIESGQLQKGIKVRAFRQVRKTGEFKTLASGQSVAIKKADVGVQIVTSTGKHDDPGFGGAQVELGRPRTKKFRAKPFLRPALYSSEALVRAMIAKDILAQIAVTKANNIK